MWLGFGGCDIGRKCRSSINSSHAIVVAVLAVVVVVRLTVIHAIRAASTNAKTFPLLPRLAPACMTTPASVLSQDPRVVFYNASCRPRMHLLHF